MAVEPFPQVDASDWPRVGEEPDGLSEHHWFRRPDDDRLWLFKPVVQKDGRRQGEDWAEKTVSQVALLLGIPCATTDLARRQDQEGLVSRDIRPTNWDMQPGAVLLGGLMPDYQSRTRSRAGHNLENIELALRELAPPPQYKDLPEVTAFDVFAGYLVLDAIVANSDRHDHNWAVLVPPHSDAVCLSPTYDHASSLGFNLEDQARAKVLTEGRMDQWASRGRAHRFEHEQPASSVESLVDLAVRGLGRASRPARDHWVGAVRSLTDEDLVTIVDRIPVMSDVASTFACELMRSNRDRLLAAWDEESPE